MRSVTFLVLVILVLTACAAPPDEPPRPTPTKLLFEDQRLRPVRMASGHALGYAQPETASQIMCQLLDKDDWERLLDGRIGRKPLSAPYAGCQIATEHGMVSLQLLKRDAAFEADTTIAGRPATMDENSFGSPIFTVALTDDALQSAPRQYYPARRLLELQVVSDDAEERVDVGTRVLNKILPLLMKEGEPLPDIDTQGHVRYVSTPLTKDFVDLPEPVQALQLCTLLQEEPSVRVTARQVDVFDTGRCVLSTEQGTVGVEAQQVPYPVNYPDEIAGRPAWTTDDPPVVTVRLRDDADVQLSVSAPDSVALAEKLVPLLVS